MTQPVGGALAEQSRTFPEPDCPICCRLKRNLHVPYQAKCEGRSAYSSCGMWQVEFFDTARQEIKRQSVRVVKPRRTVEEVGVLLGG